jgi:hypothetical protein
MNMSDDNVLRGSVIIDTGGLDHLNKEVETTAQSIQRLNASFIQQGLTAEEARSALINLGESASVVDKSLGKVASTSVAATSGISGLDRAMATATGRMLVTEAGLGRIGFSMVRVGMAAGVLGPILSAAFPVIALVGVVELFGTMAEKFLKFNESALKTADAEHAVNETINKQEDELRSLNERYVGITQGPMAEFALKMKDAELASANFSSISKEIIKALQDESSWWTTAANKIQHYADVYNAGATGQKTAVGGSTSPKQIEDFIRLTDDNVTSVKDLAKAYDAVLAKMKEIRAELQARQDSGRDTSQQVQEINALQNEAQALQNRINTAKGQAAVDNAEEEKRYGESVLAELKRYEEERTRAMRQEAGEIRQTHEEGMKISKEGADEELEQIARVAAANKQAAEEDERLRRTQLTQIEKQGSTELKTIESSTAMKISEAEKSGNLGGAGATAASGFAQSASVLQGLITAESSYQQAVSKSNLEIEKKNQLILESGLRQTQLQDEIVSQFQKTEKLEQEIGDKNPWKIMQTDLQRTTTLLSAQTSAAQNFTNQLNSGVGSALTQWIVSGKNFGKSMEDTFVHILASEASFVAEWLLKKAELWAMDAIIGKPSQISSAMGSVTANAAVAASGAAASVAAIPFVGWAMAPEVAAETFASTMAYASLIAFEKGGIVGRTGPILAHQGEAVLPRSLTHMLQSAAGGRGGNAGKGITINYNPHISAIDTRGMSDVLRAHSDLISASVEHAMRQRNM